jgi:hypothetical protein
VSTIALAGLYIPGTDVLELRGVLLEEHVGRFPDGLMRGGL